MSCWSTTGSGLRAHEYHESNPSTDDAETTSAYPTAAYQQPVVGEEHGAPACLGRVGRNPETTKYGYVEGLCCRLKT